MIKGQEISTLMTINDTTSGRLSVWIMVIMLLMLRFIYLVAYQKLEEYRYQRLVELQNKIELVLSGGMENTPESDEPAIHTKKPHPVTPVWDEDAEAMELFESLRSKRGM